MSDSIEWGPEIAVNGVRPEWLKNEDVGLFENSKGCWIGGIHMPLSIWDWGVSEDSCRPIAIRLPADHWAYPVIAAGLTPWRSDVEKSPEGDGPCEVMLRRGSCDVDDIRSWLWETTGDDFDIIGYRFVDVEAERTGTTVGTIKVNLTNWNTAVLIAELRTRTDLPEGVVLPEPEPDWEAYRSALDAGRKEMGWGELGDEFDDLEKQLIRALIAARPYMPQE